MRKLSMGIGIVALSAFVAAAQASEPTAATPTSTAAGAAISKLPDGPGHDTVIKVCSACHSPEIAAQQRLSKQGWNDLVGVMASRGAPGSEKDFAVIADYLAKNFPETPAK